MDSLAPRWRHLLETFSALLALCHKGQWRGAWMFSAICVWINGWVNNHKAGDLRHRRAHYDVTVMDSIFQFNMVHVVDKHILQTYANAKKKKKRKKKKEKNYCGTLVCDRVTLRPNCHRIWITMANCLWNGLGDIILTLFGRIMSVLLHMVLSNASALGGALIYAK